MGAAIVQHAHRAVGAAHHDHRLAAEPRAIEIARLRHLAFMADEEPSLSEQALDFEFNTSPVDIDRAMSTRSGRIRSLRLEFGIFARQAPMAVPSSENVGPND